VADPVLPMGWSSIWRELCLAGGPEPGRTWTDQEAIAFMKRLEERGLTVVPLQVRRNADLFGIGMLVNADDGYSTLDPTSWTIEAVREEPKGG